MIIRQFRDIVVLFDDLGIIESTQSGHLTSFHHDIPLNRRSCWHIMRCTRCLRSYNDGFEIRIAVDAGECQEERVGLAAECLQKN